MLGGTGANAVRVGIGTTTPAATLHVAGASSTVRLTGLAGNGTRVVTTDADGDLSTTTTASLGDNYASCAYPTAKNQAGVPSIISPILSGWARSWQSRPAGPR